MTGRATAAQREAQNSSACRGVNASAEPLGAGSFDETVGRRRLQLCPFDAGDYFPDRRGEFTYARARNDDRVATPVRFLGDT